MDPELQNAMALGLALIFAAAVVHKVQDFKNFIAILTEYRVTPVWSTFAVGVVLFISEAAAAVMILLSGLRQFGAFMIIGLLALYGVGMAVNLIRGRQEIDCGCSGPGAKQMISWWLIGRNAAMVIPAALCLFPVDYRELIKMDYLSIGGFAVIFLVAYQTANHLLASWPRVASLRGV